METWRAELYHHGIEGQKWGVRNGPPYPLDSSQLSGRERRMAKKVEKTMDKATKKYAKNAYKAEYADSKEGKQEKAQHMAELAKEFTDSQQYKDIMERKYSDVILKQNISDSKRPERIARAIVSTISMATIVACGKYLRDRYF